LATAEARRPRSPSHAFTAKLKPFPALSRWAPNKGDHKCIEPHFHSSCWEACSPALPLWPPELEAGLDRELALQDLQPVQGRVPVPELARWRQVRAIGALARIPRASAILVLERIQWAPATPVTPTPHRARIRWTIVTGRIHWVRGAITIRPAIPMRRSPAATTHQRRLIIPRRARRRRTDHRADAFRIGPPGIGAANRELAQCD
jgi:hypothetical protein